ncbi:MAG: anthranilate phosphoribosyltransferase [Acidimicrobiales bacterium]|nr:anthranilate phosphoribosyltransferase [Acidimicrobiales bacterium]MXX43018.1 anthranilate phosphoribosyltransferase [Acidimicrobiales bacterium]MYA83883.1 anthranilate phosphoribosyltransferase [Acidimicrobiales bacterium]MYB80941.1 anthranilate phosphoribosyltransferase [Acidimicrobiales bacterium]MYD33588.1 anthranilate phosphoribosyltransferase [Acidimicrobiales bacterium]
MGNSEPDEAHPLEHYGGWKSVLTDLVAGIDLSPEVARAALGSILSERATDAQLAGFIIALGMKGGSVPELTGLVDAMHDAAVPLTAPDGAIDIVGSGGAPVRQRHALSVSTMAAFVAAAAGAVICKHGSVAATSSSGSFDTLGALGLVIDLDGPDVERCIAEIGLGFAFAKKFHPAMRFAGPVRSELGVPTTFNFLGPLSNPARVKRQVLGVSDPVMAPRVAGVLAARGSERSLVVHGADRLDEITLTDLTRIYEVRNGEIANEYQFDPTSIGLERVNRAELWGGSPLQNAEILHRIVSGDETGPRAQIVELNAGAGLVVAGLAENFAEGFEMARDAVADGRAAAKLEAAVRLTNELAASSAS